MSINAKRSRFGNAAALASRLKHRVVIQRRTRSGDGAGGSSVVWGNVASVWAEIRSRSRGDERQFAGKIEAEVSHEMVLRYRSDVTADMRVLYAGTAYNIRRVVNVDEADVLLELLLETGTSD